MAYEFYDLLGVERSASADDIKKAYRKKAMELHPDRHQWDKTKEAEFKKVNEAYSILSDAQKKAHYDRFGTADAHGGMHGGGFSGNGMHFDFGDIFESFFWGGFSSQDQGHGGGRQKTGSDIEVEITLSFEEAILGVTKDITYKKDVLCSDCGGTGAKKWSDVSTCPDCHGQWRVRQRSQTIFGVMEQVVGCPKCSGTGKIIKDPCRACHGKKYVSETTTKTVDVPAGIDDGMTIKLRSEWNVASGWAGDLYVHFSVPESYEWLTRDESDLIYELLLDPVEFVLGTKKEIDIPIIGKRPIDIKAWTEPGSELVFKHEGVPHVSRHGKGSLIIRLAIVIPKKLSKKEKELYEAIAKERKLSLHDERSLFEKLFD